MDWRYDQVPETNSFEYLIHSNNPKKHKLNLLVCPNQFGAIFEN